MKQSLPIAVICVVSLMLSACASNGTQTGSAAYDPFESFNRKMYAFNTGVDKVMLKPLAKGYKKVMPSPVRRGFANVFANLGAPRSSLNNSRSPIFQRSFSTRMFSLPR